MEKVGELEPYIVGFVEVQQGREVVRNGATGKGGGWFVTMQSSEIFRYASDASVERVVWLPKNINFKNWFPKISISKNLDLAL
jgi:hypothetical protein